MEDLSTINSKIEEGLFSIELKRKARSNVWEIFGEIMNEENEKIPNIVACKMCKKAILFKSSTTTNLLRHKCYIKAKPSRQNMINVNTTEKKNILSAAVLLCVEDMRPFSIISGGGMNKFVLAVLEIESKYGAFVNIDHMLPSPATISNNVEKIVEHIVPIVKKELKEVHFFAATTDL